MNPRFSTLTAIAVAILLAPVSILAQAPVPSGNQAAKPASVAGSAKWTVPRLPDGRPDIGGFWTNNTLTPFERPKEFAGRELLTSDEAKALQQAAIERRKAGDRQAIERPNEVGSYNSAFSDGDSRFLMANKRNSIITDPKDGRMPHLTPEAQRKFEADKEYHSHHLHDGPEDMTTIERCITWITSGPPMLPSFYNNNYQIVQTHDHLSIVTEMVHDVRIIPLDGRPHEDVRQWMGDSRGHWEGDTLVVETINFNGKRGYFGAPMTEGSGSRRPDAKMRVIERFTRTAPDILLYQFTVDDPGYFTRPWSGEITMKSFEGPVYEYACHEGNYGMQLILSGARADEKKAEGSAKKGSN